jgi:RNA recognition motif-containing protein
MFHQVSMYVLALFLVSNTEAFVGSSPFGGRIHQSYTVSSQVLLSEPTEPAESPAKVKQAFNEVESNAEVETAFENVSYEDAMSDDLTTERERFTAFVGNLPFSCTFNDVRDLFSSHGNVVFVKLPRYKDSGQARGFAFVDMATEEELSNIIVELNGFEFKGRKIRVVKSLPRDEAGDVAKTIDKGIKKLYVGNITFDTETDDLREFFGKYGEVYEVYLPLRSDGKRRGFAFVSVKEEDFDRVLEATNGSELKGRLITVSRPLPPGEKSAYQKVLDSRKKLYVGNLSFYTSAETVTEMFEEFGEVYDCFLPQDPLTGSSRGFGFVTMDKEAAECAMAEINGCELDGRVVRVHDALSKNQKKRFQDQGNFADSFDE